jgi:FkbM family methyltransferase
MQKVINWLKILFTDPKRIFVYFKNMFLWRIVTYFSKKYKLSIVYRHLLWFDIFLSGRNNIVEQEVVLKWWFEDYLVNFYARNFKNDSILLDVWCNFGLFSLLWWSKIKNWYIYSFDADPSMINLINKSISLNKYNNIKTINNAISDKIWSIDFNIVDDPAFNSIAKVEWHKLIKKIKVPATTLDNFVKENNLSKVDFIKMDIEWAELPALKWWERMLKELKPILSIEIWEKNFSYFNYTSNEIMEYMQKLWYIVYNYRNSRLEKEIIKKEYIYDNLIFIHKDNKIAII